jgi:oleate hydratase
MSHHAHMIGAGIGNLAAAAYLIRDGEWDGSDITIYGLETHGANDGQPVADFAGEYGHSALKNSLGFLNRGGRMLNEPTYENLWDVLRTIPSLDRPGTSVTDDILDFDHEHRTHDRARLIDRTNGVRNKGDELDSSHMQFSNQDRLLLTKLMLIPESREHELDDVSIERWFEKSPDFFTTNFWWMWQTTFAFQKASSAMELRRYMHRMILEFTRINTLEGVTRTPWNQYESIILPMRAWLSDHGVTLVSDVKVTEFVFRDSGDEILVTGLKYVHVADGGLPGIIDVDEDDAVFDTNGSITDSTSLGDLDTPVTEDHRYAPSAALWKQGAERFPELGQPDKFFGDRSQSEWMSFTITSNTRFLLEEIEAITGQRPGNALNTWVDSNVLLSIVVPWQPHFHAQKENEGVIWGYCLYPRRAGDFVKKPFIEMTGREILGELLGQLAAVDTRADGIAGHRQQILDSVVNVVPVLMPYASALFNRRAVGDRPLVVPKRSKNLAFISQFAELPYDMVFTEQYSVRCAQVAAYHFLGLPASRLTKINRYDRDPRVLLKATQTMFR